MNKILREKINESLSSVLPITAIVLLLSVTVTPMPVGTLAMFLAGAVMLILGMAFFSLGTDVAMTPMGDGIGAQMTKTKRVSVVIIITLIIGILITIAEPDLQVLANQVPSIPNMVLILTVALGVGLFFVLAVLRTLYRISLPVLLLIFYTVVFVLSIFVPNEFVSVAFDSGGVTTGLSRCPLLWALGVGLASIRGDKGAQDDSFGLVALCSIGPILAVLLLGIFYNGGDPSYTPVEMPGCGYQPGLGRGVLSGFACVHQRGFGGPAAYRGVLCHIPNGVSSLSQAAAAKNWDRLYLYFFGAGPVSHRESMWALCRPAITWAGNWPPEGRAGC